MTQLLRRFNTHALFIKKSSTLSDAVKPLTMTKDVKWTDWVPSFLNYLRTIPGRDGNPLKYVCRAKDAPDPIPNSDFLDDYVTIASLSGKAFTIDSNEVFMLIVKFITGNETKEAKI